jgi:hypothetical protein
MVSDCVRGDQELLVGAVRALPAGRGVLFWSSVYAQLFWSD